MTSKTKVLWRLSGLLGLGLGVAIWLIPRPVQAGDVHFFIGLGIPAPVAVLPPPVVVAPAPVFVQPAPVIAYPSRTLVVQPPSVYPRHLPPWVARKYYGSHPYGYHPGHGYRWHRYNRYRQGYDD